jgi:hypothetical protein
MPWAESKPRGEMTKAGNPNVFIGQQNRAAAQDKTFCDFALWLFVLLNPAARF